MMNDFLLLFKSITEASAITVSILSIIIVEKELCVLE